MDPLTGFVSIVGLISIFKQEGKTKENQSREAFFQWLDDHRHEDLKEFVLRSKELPSEIDRALQRKFHGFLLFFGLTSMFSEV